MKFSSLNTKIGILLLLLLFISLLFYTQYLSLNSNSLSLLTSAKTYNQSQSPTCAPPPLRCPKGSTCNNQSKTCVSPQTPTGTQVPTVVPTSASSLPSISGIPPCTGQPGDEGCKPRKTLDSGGLDHYSCNSNLYPVHDEVIHACIKANDFLRETIQ